MPGPTSSPWKIELGATLRLAGPVVLGQLGLMAMNLVDTAVVGRLGPAAVAAVSVGHAASMLVFMFGFGLLVGLDRTVAFAFGGGQTQDVRRAITHGLVLGAAVSVPLTAAMLVVRALLPHLGVDAAVVEPARAYQTALTWSILPSMLFTALRQALQGIGDTGAATRIALLANLVNLGGNLLLVPGRWGLPALGVAGSGWATCVSRVFMAGLLGLHAWRSIGPLPRWRWDAKLDVELLRLGLPAGVQMVFEGGVFVLVTFLAARLGAAQAASHHLVLLVASFTFMVPMGLSSAGSVRVGQALGRGDLAGARRAGTTSVAVGVAFMALSAACLTSLARPILGLFGQPADVVELARLLLLCAGVFQVFDGAQVTLAGALRGADDTMSAMAANLVGHWAVGLPLGALLCYRAGWGVMGLWVGLAAGLAAVAVWLGLVWHRRIGAPVAAARPLTDSSAA
jgi:MATE family multidrug resistance protein